MSFTLPSRIHHDDITDVCSLFKQELQQWAGNSNLTFRSNFLCSLALQPLLSHFARLLFLCGCLKNTHTHCPCCYRQPINPHRRACTHTHFTPVLMVRAAFLTCGGPLQQTESSGGAVMLMCRQPWVLLEWHGHTCAYTTHKHAINNS